MEHCFHVLSWVKMYMYLVSSRMSRPIDGRTWDVSENGILI